MQHDKRVFRHAFEFYFNAGPPGFSAAAAMRALNPTSDQILIQLQTYSEGEQQ